MAKLMLNGVELCSFPIEKQTVSNIYPMICSRCGGQLEINHNEIKCPWCGTEYSTKLKVAQ